MATITPERIADIIEEAPAWARVGITVPSERVRADARLELARHVYRSLFPIGAPECQLRLPL